MTVIRTVASLWLVSLFLFPAGLSVAQVRDGSAGASDHQVLSSGPAMVPAGSQVALGLPERGDPLGGIISELRGGILAHDVGVVSSDTEDGVDINGEVLFASPEFLSIILAPRPHLGFSVSTEGETNQVYGGLTWGLDIAGGLFAEFAFGGSVHDGDLNPGTADKNEFGCRILFREALELGWRFGGHHSISVMIDHISNGGLCDRNDGMDNAGIRYGYKF